jgi:hypothetical protein
MRKVSSILLILVLLLGAIPANSGTVEADRVFCQERWAQAVLSHRR